MDTVRYDDDYRCGFCQGRVYVAGNTTHYYRCAGCGLCPVTLIQPNSEDREVTVVLKATHLALLFSAALYQRNEYDYHSVTIKNKWEEIISRLSKALEHQEKLV